MKSYSEPVQRYLDLFSRFSTSQGRDDNLPMHALRSSAIARFSERGFPSQADEDWKYTNTNPIIQTPFIFPEEMTNDVFDQENFAGHSYISSCSARLVFVDGKLSPGASHFTNATGGLIITSLAQAFHAHEDLVLSYLDTRSRESRSAFGDLNTAFLSDGAFVFVPKRTFVEEPIHLIFLSSKSDDLLATNPRVLLIADEGAGVTLVETHATTGEHASFSNAQTEMFIDANASVEHYAIQDHNNASYHTGNLHVVQSRNSRCVSHSFILGGALVRNDVTFVLEGEGCEASLNGLALTHGSQHADSHTTIDHAAPQCASHEHYKYIANGKSRGVFNGKIIVRKDAQKTDARQSNNNLILSDEASIDTRPQLEIFANDVKCTHGATIGRLDEEALFYLKSRGIGESDARDILIRAFADEIVERVSIASLREYLHKRIQAGVRNGTA